MCRKIVSNYFKKRLFVYYQKQRRSSRIQTFNNSKSAGILWNPVDEGSIETYELLRKILKDKGIKAIGIGHIDSKREKDTFATIAHSGFSNNVNISFSGRPKKGDGLQFLQEQFDILIDLSIQKVLALQYILVHSIAAFKVGWESSEYNYYDLNIDVKGNPQCRYLMEQIVYYLENINAKQ
jgi:hypothetical protein